MLKRVLSSFTVVVMLSTLVALSGCGKSADTSQGTKTEATVVSSDTTKETVSDEKVTVRILTRNTGDSLGAKGYTERITQFQKENPNITVDDWSANDNDAAATKFKASIAAGDPPEIFVTYHGGPDKGYVKSGLVADLTPIMEADKTWADGIDAKYFDAWKYSDIKGVYGVPYQVFGVGIFYNKDLFKKVGVEPPKTMEELIDISAKFNEAGITPFALGAKDAWRFGHFFGALAQKMYGPEKVVDLNAEPQKAKWDDKDMINLYSYMNDKLFKGGVFGKKLNFSIGYNEEVSMFQTEKAAMRMDGTWYISGAVISPIADKIGYIPFPSLKDFPQYKDAWMGGASDGLSLSGAAKGATKDAAVKLLKYITGKEYAQYMWKITKGTFAPCMTLEADPEVTASPLMTAFLENIAKATSVTQEPAFCGTINSLIDVERNSLQGMAIGQITPEQLGKALQEEVDKNSK